MEIGERVVCEWRGIAIELPITIIMAIVSPKRRPIPRMTAARIRIWRWQNHLHNRLPMGARLMPAILPYIHGEPPGWRLGDIGDRGDDHDRQDYGSVQQTKTRIARYVNIRISGARNHMPNKP